jgi:hypothetical protein
MEDSRSVLLVVILLLAVGLAAWSGYRYMSGPRESPPDSMGAPAPTPGAKPSPAAERAHVNRPVPAVQGTGGG